MNSPLNAVATTFCVGATLLGVPSLAVTFLYGLFRLRLWFAAPPSPSNFPKNPDAILLILDWMTRAVGGAATLVSSVGQIVFGGIALVAGIVLVMAVAFFFTGRGLHAHQGWARGVGGLLMGGMLVVSLLSLTALRGPLFVLPALVSVGSVYSLWALWRGFAA